MSNEKDLKALKIALQVIKDKRKDLQEDLKDVRKEEDLLLKQILDEIDK